MKLGLTALLATVLAAGLLVPAAGAKPGNGNGHGPPAWAGQGQAKKAEKAERKAEKAEQKAERRAARAAAQAPDADAPKHSNPAWICKFEREQMGAEAFAEEYGTNENKANAFGKCVSREAHERDGVETEGAETPAPVDEGTSDPVDSTDDGEPEDAGATAAVQAFLQYLWPFI
jgi:hypothetical protein